MGGLMEQFENSLKEIAQLVSEALSVSLRDALLSDEIARPARLLKAMRHGALNGGKRLRPFLVIETAGLFGVTADAAMQTALALECVHCYSLIHDDLPAMDDDDLRRGQPTVHVAFDEATAILAGDSLLTFSFDLLADEATHKDPSVRSELVLQLARAAGHGGMAGGQMLDLEAERKTPDEQGIIMLQSMKTGALLRFACEAGAILGGASREDRARVKEFGIKIGQAFQLADDILDLTSTAEQMGKKVGKDADAGKGTLVSLWGLDRAKAKADELVVESEVLLLPFGERADVLKACARYIVNRGK
jgi:farnesyl diphosphate synthase